MSRTITKDTPSTTPFPSTPDDYAQMVFLATNDISARTKGRALPRKNLTKDTSVGWVPANIGIGPLGHIVDGIPWGTTGDLRLKPDFNAEHLLTGVPGKGPLSVIFSDIVKTNGEPSEQCTRTYLKNTVQALKSEFGITAGASIEYEFVDLSATTNHHPFSLQNYLSQEPLGSRLVAAMEKADLDPETWLAEYGEHQYEITMRPSDPVTAGDRATLLRDLVNDVFSSAGREVTFAPTAKPGGGGSGMHMHFGLQDENGESIIFDESQAGRVSQKAARFAQGIIKYSREMTAFFAPLVTSYDRLTPHNWSTARSFFGLQNREALLRITPTNEIDGKDPKPQLHFEFRGADAGVNPWLLINLVLRAGLEGLRQNLEPAEVVEGELDLDVAHKNLMELPKNLGDALEVLESGEGVRSWFAPEFIENYLVVKRDEIESLKGKSAEELCEVYARVY
jgi:glutamine synthetase